VGRKGNFGVLGRYGKVIGGLEAAVPVGRRRRVLGDNAKEDALGDDARKGWEC
jgi:HAMP domain-containing protein